MKTTILSIAVTAAVSFSFGWSACGYSVYKGFFNQNAALMGKLK